MDVWREFEHNEITHSGAHYLMTVQQLIEDQGYARVSDVAREMHITPGSASIMIKSLREKGYLEEDRNRFLKLSDEGNRLAQSVWSHMVVRSAASMTWSVQVSGTSRSQFGSTRLVMLGVLMPR